MYTHVFLRLYFRLPSNAGLFVVAMILARYAMRSVLLPFDREEVNFGRWPKHSPQAMYQMQRPSSPAIWFNFSRFCFCHFTHTVYVLVCPCLFTELFFFDPLVPFSLSSRLRRCLRGGRLPRAFSTIPGEKSCATAQVRRCLEATSDCWKPGLELPVLPEKLEEMVTKTCHAPNKSCKLKTQRS